MRDWRFSFRVGVCATILLIVSWGFVLTECRAETRPKPVRTWDLHPLGYANGIADYSLAGFLSEDVLLVAINQAPIDYAHPLFREKPDATLILFSLDSGKTLGTAQTPMFKFNDSMAPVLDGHFLVLTQSEVKLCSIDLQCDRSFPTKGPLWVTPDRARAVVGGNLGSPQVVLDSRTLAPIFEAGLNAPDIPAKPTPSYSRDGGFAESISSVDGQRFLKVAVNQTGWNKFTNPLAGFGDRPYNSRRITVYDKTTGKDLFTMRWDPRHTGGGVTTMPALSPTGHRVALLRLGVVEVFEIP